MSDPLLIGKNQHTELVLLPGLANRHGCITGATGTGKTVTLQTMAQALSRIGVPVFMADVKGDLSGLAKPGSPTPRVQERIAQLKLDDPKWEGCPVTFWDVFGEKGHPARATVADLGPLLLARMLNLNEVQQGVLQLVFKVADDNGLLLLDMKDLRAMLQHVGEHTAELQTEYGNISAASIGAIQRGLIAIEEQGGKLFFGEPMLNIEDFMQTDGNGRGVVNILAADRLLNSPRLYAVFLLWMLSELFEHLPEVGDVDKPKLVFFFDEAHLLFDEAPKVLLQKIEQVVRLIRSKGVGVYFVTQIRSTFPIPCSASSATACSTPCAPTRRAIRRRCRRPRRPSARIRSSIPPRPSPNSASAKRWCPSSMKKARRTWSSAPSSCRRYRRSGR
jgi:hypothetical protein